MKLSYEVVALRTRHAFTIARGADPDRRNVIVRLVDDDGAEGWGEAAGNRFYGENADTVVAALEMLRPVIARTNPLALESLEADMARELRFNAAARSAVSAAAHDLVANRLGVPLHQLWGLDTARMPASSFTIAIPSDDDDLRARLREAAAYPVLKVKLGTGDLQRDRLIVTLVAEEARGKTLYVDANAAWSPKDAVWMAAVLGELGVEFLEQPVPAHDVEGLRFVRERSPIPVIADESCLVATDVARLVGAVDGVNVKLAKCGGLREALKIVHTARAHDLLVMAGCMVETSLGITTAAHLAPLLDYADLDGAALLAEDPFEGATIERGEIRLPSRAGIGAVRRV